jgi:hypothetical protein
MRDQQLYIIFLWYQYQSLMEYIHNYKGMLTTITLKKGQLGACSSRLSKVGDNLKTVISMDTHHKNPYSFMMLTK